MRKILQLRPVTALWRAVLVGATIHIILSFILAITVDIENLNVFRIIYVDKLIPEAGRGWVSFAISYLFFILLYFFTLVFFTGGGRNRKSAGNPEK